MAIAIQRTTHPKTPDAKNLGFGVFTDHMFVLDYNQSQGWHNPRIEPYGPFLIEPGALVLHYAQAIFEGMKAYRGQDGRHLLFRPTENMRRLNRGCQRMAIPAVDEELVLQGIKELVHLEQAWIPDAPGTSLYIRPFIVATEPFLGPRAAFNYKLMVILSPVGSYFAGGLKPVSIFVEPKFIRAAPGGTGNVKAAGNYAPQLSVQERVAKEGWEQVLWLDGVEHKYIEEVGAMNVFFNIAGELITPELGDTILPGITRNTVITLLKAWGIPVSERKLSIEELFTAQRAGNVVEAFGCGTAAVISPIGKLSWQGEVIEIGEGKAGAVSQRLYDTITGMQTGRLADEYGWVVEAKV